MGDDTAPALRVYSTSAVVTLHRPDRFTYSLVNGWVAAQNDDEALGKWTGRVRELKPGYGIGDVLILEMDGVALIESDPRPYGTAGEGGP